MAISQTEYRVRFILDPDAGFEECNGENRPLTAEEYAENAYMKDGQPIPYDEYLGYYGNPERHVYLQSEVQKKCKCCGTWKTVGGTGSIDFMDDSPELRHQGKWFTAEDLEAEWPGEHLRLIGLGDLAEAGARLPKTVKCARKSCRYWHVIGSKFCARHQEAR